MRTALRILVVTLMGSLAAAGQGELTLVDNGKPRATIVVSTNASKAAVAGAGVLREHVRQISGASLTVSRDGELGDITIEGRRVRGDTIEKWGGVVICVGESELTRRLGVASDGLGPGGIIVRTVGNVLVLMGADDRTPADVHGSMYAVTTFLEDELGCRYLWPGESGKVVPKRRTISVRPLNVRFTPGFVQRQIRSNGYSSRIGEGLDRLGRTREDFVRMRKEAAVTQAESPDWMRWHRLGGTLGLRTGDGTILPGETWDRFLREHPEWFAMQKDGSRFFDPDWERPRLCKSNPDLVEAIIQEKLKELKRYPGRTSISLMTNDGGGKAGFCLCEKCKAMDPPEGRPTEIWTYEHESERTRRFEYVSVTDRMIAFYNAIAEGVAKEYPDMLFTGQAYSIYSAPPLRHKLHPNIVIRLVHNTEHYLCDQTRRQGMADWDAWATMAGKIFWRPNSLLVGRMEGTPAIVVHKLAEDFRHIASSKCVGTDFDSCMHHWATQGLNYYVLAKLHWNPEADVDAIIDDYCESGFGKAAGSIRRYLRRIEKLTDETAAVTPQQREGRRPDVTMPYTDEVVKELRALLDRATKKVAGDDDVRKRIAFLRIGLDFAALQGRIYQLLRESYEKRLTQAEREEARDLLDRKWLMMRDIFEKNHYAVNVSGMCWGEWWRFKRLGWEGPSEQVKKVAGVK